MEPGQMPIIATAIILLGIIILNNNPAITANGPTPDKTGYRFKSVPYPIMIIQKVERPYLDGKYLICTVQEANSSTIFINSNRFSDRNQMQNDSAAKRPQSITHNREHQK